MRKLIIALALLAVAMPAAASVQNVKVYGNLDTTYVHRQGFNLGADSTVGNGSEEQNQDDIISQTRLGVDADLTDNVSTTIGLINERVWTADHSATGATTGLGTTGDTNDTNVDIYLAYATLREMLYSPLTVVVGRQQFGYGNRLVFDATGANNVAPSDSGIQNVADDLTYQTSLDAVRVILDYNPLTIEGFFALVNSGTAPALTGNAATTEWSNHVQGVNASYNLGDDMNSVVEAYFFDETSGNDHAETTKVTGLRASTNPLEGLNLQLEFAKQFGHDTDSTSRQAYAAQAMASYKLPVLEDMKPMLSYTLTKVSGDDNAADGKNQAWNPFYEAQGAGTVYNQLFDLTNLTIHSLALEITPIEDLTAKLSGHSLWKTNRTGSLSVNNVYGLGSVSATTEGDTADIGKEIDFGLSYAYTEDVTIGATAGLFVPKTAFASNNDEAAKQVLVSLGVKF